MAVSHLPVYPTERLWLPPRSAGGGNYAGRVLSHGSAVVRGRDRPFHLPRQQPEGGVRLLRSGRAAQVPGHPGATRHGVHDLRPHGLLCFHDLCAQSETLLAQHDILTSHSLSWLIRQSYVELQVDWLELYGETVASLLLSTVYSHASPVWSLPLHGGLFTQRHSSKSDLIVWNTTAVCKGTILPLRSQSFKSFLLMCSTP